MFSWLPGRRLGLVEATLRSHPALLACWALVVFLPRGKEGSDQPSPDPSA